MRTVIIDGGSIKSTNDFHKSIKRLLNFPEYYGENLDALWDCLTDIEMPLTIIWKDHEISAAYLNVSFTKIAKVFNHFETQLKGFAIKYE